MSGRGDLKLYAHRANVSGPGSGENRLDAVQECLRQGLGVEVDVWGEGDALLVGHEPGGWRAARGALEHPLIMCHAKNLEAVRTLQARGAQFFCLEQDAFALCSNGLIWANYGCAPSPSAIMCSPELVGAAERPEAFLDRVAVAYGICTDYPLHYLKQLGGQTPRGNVADCRAWGLAPGDRR